MASPLTPRTRLQTNAPYLSFTKDKETGLSVLLPDPSKKITIESCAEFLDYQFLGSRFGTGAGFRILHDLDGQIVVLSVGTDKHLYLCTYINGGSGGWQAFDITPEANFLAEVFDATRSHDGKKILIAVSGYGSDKTKTKIHQAVFDCPRLVADAEGRLNEETLPKFKWLETGDSISARKIQALVCGSFRGDAQYQLIASVNASSRLEGSHYIYDSSVNRWILLKLGQQVETFRSCAHANVPKLGEGTFVLFEDASKEKNLACLFQASLGGTKQVFLTSLKNPRKLSVSVNERGLTDLLVAAENGIGYVNHQKLGDPAELLLEGIAFADVLCAEFKISEEKNGLVIYALSTHGELYIVEGSRMVADKKNVQFQASGIPIRNNIGSIAGRVNPRTGAFEVVYVTRDNDNLRHLSRDPISFLWKETEMVVMRANSPERVIAKAFVVAVTLSDGKGIPVPAGYQVQLTSSPCLIFVNDRTYNLDLRPQSIGVNAFGQLQIVVPAADALGAAPIGIKFMPETGETSTFYIQPAQRILHILGTLKTGDQLREARTSDNRPFFPSSMKEKNRDKFDTAAQLLSQVPAMIAAADGQIPAGDSLTKGQDITIDWQKSEEGTSQGSDRSWLSQAVDATGKFIGEAIEFLKMTVKEVTKIALRAIGPVLHLFLKIGAKVLRFALESVSSIISGITYALEGLFDGLDLSSVRDWFAFRYIKVEATQKELAFAVDNSLLLASRYLHHHRNAIVDGIDTIGKFLEEAISRPSSLSHGSQESLVDSILDNPIIANLLKFNPLGWIMEAATEELGEGFKIPSLDLGIGRQIFAALKEQLDLLWGYLKRNYTRLRAAIHDSATAMEHLKDAFRDGFWTIFDALKAIIIRIFDLALNSFDKIADFCRAKWEIPYLTDLWTEITNTDFTLINFVTYVAAQIIELFNPGSKPVFANHSLRTVFENPEQKKIPGLLPESWTADFKAYQEAAGELDFKQQMMLTSQMQREGAKEMAANPVKEPRFGLMTAAAPSSTQQKEYEAPPVAARWIVALARSGKLISRSFNVAVEGVVMQGMKKADNIDGPPGAGGGGPRAGDIEMVGRGRATSMDDYWEDWDYISPEWQQEIAREAAQAAARQAADAAARARGSFEYLGSTKGSWSGSVGSSQGRGSFLSDSTVSQPAGVAGAADVKKVLIGSHAFGCICRIAEQITLYNYYDEHCRNAENFDGNCVELLASVAGLILAFFADTPPLMALSNLVTSAGCFAGAWFQPEEDVFTISEKIGSGASTISSVLFLVPESTCQTGGWIGVGVDVVNTGVSIGYQCYRAANPKLIGPHSHTPHQPQVKDPEKKIKKVISATNVSKIKRVIDKCQALTDQYRVTPLGDPCLNCANGLTGVQKGMDYEAGVSIYTDAVFYYTSRIGGAEQRAADILLQEGKIRPDQREFTVAEIQNNLVQLDNLIGISNHSIEYEYDIVEDR